MRFIQSEKDLFGADIKRHLAGGKVCPWELTERAAVSGLEVRQGGLIHSIAVHGPRLFSVVNRRLEVGLPKGLREVLPEGTPVFIERAALSPVAWLCLRRLSNKKGTMTAQGKRFADGEPKLSDVARVLGEPGKPLDGLGRGLVTFSDMVPEANLDGFRRYESTPRPMHPGDLNAWRAALRPEAVARRIMNRWPGEYEQPATSVSAPFAGLASMLEGGDDAIPVTLLDEVRRAMSGDRPCRDARIAARVSVVTGGYVSYEHAVSSPYKGKVYGDAA